MVIKKMVSRVIVMLAVAFSVLTGTVESKANGLKIQNDEILSEYNANALLFMKEMVFGVKRQ